MWPANLLRLGTLFDIWERSDVSSPSDATFNQSVMSFHVTPYGVLLVVAPPLSLKWVLRQTELEKIILFRATRCSLFAPSKHQRCYLDRRDKSWKSYLLDWCRSRPRRGGDREMSRIGCLSAGVLDKVLSREATIRYEPPFLIFHFICSVCRGSSSDWGSDK